MSHVYLVMKMIAVSRQSKMDKQSKLAREERRLREQIRSVEMDIIHLGIQEDAQANDFDRQGIAYLRMREDPDIPDEERDEFSMRISEMSGEDVVRRHDYAIELKRLEEEEAKLRKQLDQMEREMEERRRDGDSDGPSTSQMDRQ